MATRPEAVPGTKTEEGRQEAAPHSTFGIGTKALNRFYPFLSQPLANAANRKFHFTLNHYRFHVSRTPQALLISRKLFWRSNSIAGAANIHYTLWGLSLPLDLIERL